MRLLRSCDLIHPLVGLFSSHHFTYVQLFPHFCFMLTILLSQLYFWIFCHEQTQVSDDWRPEVVVGTAGISSGGPTLPQIWLSCVSYIIYILQRKLVIMSANCVSGWHTVWRIKYCVSIIHTITKFHDFN